MVNAFLATTLVGIVAGPVGYVLVLRGQSFAGHALSHVGFAGAALALLLGVPPAVGMGALTVLGGAAMGALGAGLGERDVGIGLTLSVALGAGLLFLSLVDGPSSQVTALLFGNVLGVSRAMLGALAIMVVAALLAGAAILRPLLFATVQPEVAAARGVRVRLVSVLFMAIVGLAVAASVQVVGVLLVFSLLVAPAAAALRLTGRLWGGIAAATALALAEGWGGLALAYETDWPVSFWITALGGIVYAGSLLRR